MLRRIVTALLIHGHEKASVPILLATGLLSACGDGGYRR